MSAGVRAEQRGSRERAVRLQKTRPAWLAGLHRSVKIGAASRRASEMGARLAVFSELAICGYPPADFLEKPSFLARCRLAVDELAAASAVLSTAIVAGVALPAETM